MESNEPNIFSNQSGCTITIRCESPYFYGEDLQATFTNENTTGSAYIDANEIEQNDGLTMQFTSSDKISALNVYETNSSQSALYGQMNFDFTKLPSTLPNTAPTNLEQRYCIFEVSEDPDEPYRFYRRLPDIVSTSFAKYVVNADYLYYAEVNHTNNQWVLTTKRYYFDSWSKEWILQNSSELVYANAWPDTYEILWIGILDLEPFVLVRHYSSSYDYVGLYSIAETYEPGQSPIGGWVEIPSTAAQRYFEVVATDINSNTEYWIFVNNGYNILFFRGGNNGSTFTWSDMSYVTDASQRAIEFTNGTVYRVVYIGDYLYLLGKNRSNSRTVLLKSDGLGEFTSWVDITLDYGGLTDIMYTRISDMVIIPSVTETFTEIPGVGESYDLIEKIVIFTITDMYEIRLSGWDQGFEKVKENILDNARTYFYMGEKSDNYLLIGATETGYPYTESPNNKYLIDDDILTVKTRNGSKSVTLQRNGITYNVLNALLASPTWFKIHRGDNYYMYSCTPTEGAPTHNYISTATIEYSRLYEGV
ncbi:MAG: hypothetical protein J6U54_22725 [Clostridiales bacterium]|nr:hypothetical protein [Clostridiales bacterium]